MGKLIVSNSWKMGKFIKIIDTNQIKFLENGEIYKFLENEEIEMKFLENGEIAYLSNSLKIRKLITEIPGKWGNSSDKFHKNSVFMEV